MKFSVIKSPLGPVADPSDYVTALKWPLPPARSRGLSARSLGHRYDQLTALFWHGAGASACARACAQPGASQGPRWSIQTHFWQAEYQRCGSEAETVHFLTDWRIFVHGLQGQ